MKLLNLEVQGFRSFDAMQALGFRSLLPGLYYVTGMNKVEPELGANAIGKSSLFDAAYWCLSDRTSRGLRAAPIKNWQNNERTAVITEWQTANGPLSVLRTWKPNALEVIEGDADPRPVDQPELERLLGIDPAVLLFCMYFAQFNDKFIDLSASEQSAVFSMVLGLSVWERAAETASAMVRTLTEKVQGLKENEAQFIGQAQVLLTSTTDQEERAWQKRQREIINTAVSGVAALEKAVKEHLAVVSRAKHGAVKFQALRERVTELDRLVAQQSREEMRLRTELSALQGKDYKTCPTCGAPVSNAHIKKEIAKKKVELASAEELMGEAFAKRDKEKAELEKVRGGDVDYLQAEKRLAAYKANLANGRKQIAERKAETNPYTARLEIEEQRGQELAEQLVAVQAEITARMKEIGAAQYWVKGFKEIRLMLIQESLAQLTLECNEVLFQMGLQNWAVAFDVERETKSGTINKNFTLMVQSPQMKDPVPWEVWSGGESQRLRLAVSMGFANLVSSRLGVQTNVEFWDEPSSWMTETGIEDLLVVLAERAQRQQKIILLADHRVLEFGGFAGTVNIVKSAAGSQIDVCII